MLHKDWNSKGEMLYRFPRSSIKFQGHTVQNITDFDPNWAFPDYRPVAAFKSLRFALLMLKPHDTHNDATGVSLLIMFLWKFRLVITRIATVVDEIGCTIVLIVKNRLPSSTERKILIQKCRHVGENFHHLLHRKLEK